MRPTGQTIEAIKDGDTQGFVRVLLLRYAAHLSGTNQQQTLLRRCSCGGTLIIFHHGEYQMLRLAWLALDSPSLGSTRARAWWNRADRGASLAATCHETSISTESMVDS